MAWPNYDDGDAAAAVPTVAYAPDPIAPTALVWGPAGGAYTLTTLAAGLPVQPATGAAWAVTGPLTDAQLRAAPVPVAERTTGAAAGTLAASGDALTLTPPDGTTDVLVEFTVPAAGNYNSAQVAVEVSVDGGATWVADRSGVCRYGSGSIPVANSVYTEFGVWVVVLLPGPGFASAVHRTGGLPVRCRLTNTPPSALSVKMTPLRTSGAVQQVALVASAPTTAQNAGAAEAGALRFYRRISTATTNAAQISLAGRLYSVHAANLHATNWAYLKLYQSAGAPNPAADTPVATIPLPPLSSASYQATAVGVYAFGWWHLITGGVADTDATAVAANQVVVNITY